MNEIKLQCIFCDFLWILLVSNHIFIIRFLQENIFIFHFHLFIHVATDLKLFVVGCEHYFGCCGRKTNIFSDRGSYAHYICIERSAMYQLDWSCIISFKLSRFGSECRLAVLLINDFIVWIWICKALYKFFWFHSLSCLWTGLHLKIVTCGTASPSG